MMPSPSQFLGDRPQLGSLAVAPRLPFELEGAAPVAAGDMGKAQEVEGARLAQSARLPAFRRIAAELEQARLVRVQAQTVLLQTLPQRRQKTLGLGLVLEADDHVIGITDDDHIAAGVALATGVPTGR
jgi:hypothetical protein